jgi:hypothetical protein
VLCALFLCSEPRPAGPDTSKDRRVKQLLPYSSLRGVKLQLEMRGGRVSDRLTESVTHIIVDPNDLGRAAALGDWMKDMLSKRHVRVVSPEWVRACIDAGHIIDPSPEQVVRLSSSRPYVARHPLLLD